MKRLAILVFAFLLLCGCAGAGQPGFDTPVFTAGEQEILDLVANGYTYIWDFTAPDGAKYLHYEVEYYKDGEKQTAAEQRAYSFELSNGTGRFMVHIKPAANVQYKSSLGSVDFFDHPVFSDWSIMVRDGRNSQSQGFYTGYDFANTNPPAGERYDTGHYQMRGTAPVELDWEVVMFCLPLFNGEEEVGDLAEVADDTGVLANYPYAYLLKCWFTA